MLGVSNAFKNAMQEPIKEIDTYFTYINAADDVVKIGADDILQNVKLITQSGLLRTSMLKLEMTYIGDLNLLDKRINLYSGVKLIDKTYEYAYYGEYIITEITFDKGKNITKVIGYNKMINTMIPYGTNDNYPISVYDFVLQCCEACELELENSSFLLSDYIIEAERYENIMDLTYRDILDDIAEISCSICLINESGKLEFRKPKITNEILTYANLMKLKLESEYGPVNSVVLSRQPQEDNVALFDQSSIDTNGLTEIKIGNNWIIDRDRENTISNIYNTLLGLKYYPFEAETEGLGYFEVGDIITLENENSEQFSTVLFNYSLTFNGGFKEKLYTSTESNTETNYSYVGGINKKFKNTEIIVDKQNKEIKSIIEDVEDTNKQISKLEQDIESFKFSLENGGGLNIIKNSVGWNELEFWEVEKDLNDYHVESISSVQVSKVSTSKSSIKISDNTISQEFNVKSGVTYTISMKYLNHFGDASAHIEDITNEFVIDISIVDNLSETTFTFTPTSNLCKLVIRGNDLWFTDLMLVEGENKRTWTPHQSEIYTNNVRIDEKGLEVFNSSQDTKTVINAQEFAIYDGISGEKNATFNRDLSEFQKSRFHKEMNIGKLRIIPTARGGQINVDD